MYKSNVLPHSIMSTLKRSSFLVGVAILLTATTYKASASCTYQIDNEWSTGYVASITLKNETSSAINNWNVNWQYSINRITSSWNINLSGSNPYTATNLSWNGNLAVGQSTSFGFQLDKNGSNAERPQINGTLCSLNPTSSSSSSAPAVSSSKSSLSSVSVSSKTSSSSSQPSSSLASSIAANTCIYRPIVGSLVVRKYT